MIGKRIVALFIMTIVTTATPAIYQIGVEPRVGGISCSIDITGLELDYDLTPSDGTSIVFKAYLNITNTMDVEVVLSRLDLDVYHWSSQNSEGRNRKIGTLNTTYEYIIPAAVGDNLGYICSDYSTGSPKKESSDGDSSKLTRQIFAYLTLIEDEDSGMATTKAVGDFISHGEMDITLQGWAQVGPFRFAYNNPGTEIDCTFWDTNFVIEDIFQLTKQDTSSIYSGSSSEVTTAGKFVIHAKIHNPSGIPMTLENYNFSLLDDFGVTRARGIPLSDTLDSLDPDILDASLEEKT
ncbi:MAG: hypothetical protein GY870_08930, partial [archaeon]|nr:hypothetical protein [archaeon]